MFGAFFPEWGYSLLVSAYDFVPGLAGPLRYRVLLFVKVGADLPFYVFLSLSIFGEYEESPIYVLE